jgi:signal peptidase II
MNDATNIPVSQSGWRWLWITATVFFLDQITKLWIVARITHDVDVLPVLNIVHRTNEGAAWSMGADWGGLQRWLFSALAIGVASAFIVWLRRLALSSQRLLIGGLVLIIGGAIGNLVDRLRLGHVVDFIDVHWGGWHFPAFNVADAAISIGAALVIFDSLREALRERRTKAAGTGR